MRPARHAIVFVAVENRHAVVLAELVKFLGLDDVAHNTVAAGLHDPRAKSVTLADLAELHCEVSVLTPLEPIASEADIRVGSDGIVIAHTLRRATFLPIMWEQLPTLEQFMGELKRKAGLPRSFPSADLKLWRYTVDRYE